MPLYPAAPMLVGSGFPKSGTTGTVVNAAPAGTIYRDSDTGVLFANEGTAASPYWTVATPYHPRVISYGWLGESADDIAIADTSAEFRRTTIGLIGAGSGIPATDSGITGAAGAIATTGYGPVMQFICDNVNAATIGAVPGVSSVANSMFWQPDIHNVIVADALVTQKTAITLRGMFFGFCSTLAAAWTQPCTGSGTTISFSATQGDDVAALFFSVGLTDTDGWFFPYDKNNTNASIATTATGVDCATTVAAAGTYQRLRVEVWSDGQIRAFIDKTQVSAGPGAGVAALDTDEELTSVISLANIDAGAPGNVQMDVARVQFYGRRPVTA